MNPPLRKRVEALEQQVVTDGPLLDFGGLPRDERAKLRTILVGLVDGTLSEDGARAEVAQHRIGERTGQ